MVTLQTSRFLIHEFTIVLISGIYVFCVDIRTDRLHPFTALSDRFFIAETVCLLRGTN